MDLKDNSKESMNSRKKDYDTKNMVGALKDWFASKSSVDLIRELRESEEQ
jgi:hypothetical protein